MKLIRGGFSICTIGNFFFMTDNTARVRYGVHGRDEQLAVGSSSSVHFGNERLLHTSRDVINTLFDIQSSSSKVALS